MRKNRNHGVRASRRESARFQNNRGLDVRAVKIIEPGEGTGPENFRCLVRGDARTVVRLNCKIDKQRACDRIFFANPDEQAARSNRIGNPMDESTKRSQGTLNQRFADDYTTLMQITID